MEETENNLSSVFIVTNEYGNAVAASLDPDNAEKMVALYADFHKVDKSRYEVCGLPLEYVKLPGRKAVNFSEKIARCPKCGAPVVEMSRAYSCINWKKGCRFSVWKERFGSTFTMEDAVALTRGLSVCKQNVDKDGVAYPVSWALDENHEQRFKRLT